MGGGGPALLRCLPPPPCYRAARGCSHHRDAGKLPLSPPPPLPPPSPRCCHASCRGAAANDAVLPPQCQAGHCHRAAVATATAPLLPPRCCHAARRRHPTAVLLPSLPRCYRHLRAAAAIAVPPPPLPRCCRFHRCAATTANAIALTLPPPSPLPPLRFRLCCHQAATKLPPPPPPSLQMSSAVRVEGAHLHEGFSANFFVDAPAA